MATTDIGKTREKHYIVMSKRGDQAYPKIWGVYKDKTDAIHLVIEIRGIDVVDERDDPAYPLKSHRGELRDEDNNYVGFGYRFRDEEGVVEAIYWKAVFVYGTEKQAIDHREESPERGGEGSDEDMGN